MTKVLVTGSYGQLGSELNAIAGGFNELNFIFSDVDSLDITDENALNLFFRDHKISYLVNCAAYTAVDKAEADQKNAALVNSVAPGLLANATKKTGAKMIHISTDYVFDGKSCKPYKEEDPVNPLNVYGLTKLEGEKACFTNNPQSIIIRTSWLYSSFGKNFVKTIIGLGKEGKPLKVIFDQAGTPTYARDLARVILEIIGQSLHFPHKFIPGIFHFSNEGICSWYDFARAIIDLSGISCPIKPVETSDFPTPAARPQYSVLNKKKIKDTFGFEIPHWFDSLKSCIEIIKKENINGK